MNGHFFGTLNVHGSGYLVPDEFDVRGERVPNLLEDVYRTLLFWEQDGVVVRLTGYCDDTDYRAEGGIQARMKKDQRHKNELKVGKRICDTACGCHICRLNVYGYRGPCVKPF